MRDTHLAMYDGQGRRKYLTWVERQTFRAAVEQMSDQAEKAFLLTLFHTGCRISEALELTKGRIDPKENVVVLKTLKRRAVRHFRAIPIPENLSKQLAALGEKQNEADRIWAYSRAKAYRRVKAVMMAAGIVGPMSAPKGLRHGFAVACVTKRIPITTVKKWLGHARLETTAIYLDIDGDEERNLAKRLW